MNYPKISIVTPSFNQGQFLEETIQSVLNQNYPNLEYIIIDGGSTDNSVEIIQRYEKYLTFWVSEKDKGQSDAINKGLQHCTGELFNWLNSDDFYEPDALHKVAEAFMQNPTIEVVCGKERAFYNHDRTQIQIHEGTPLNEPIEELIYNGIIDQPPTFFRKTVLDKLGLLSTDLNYRMDSDWWITYLLLFGKENVLKINDILTNFRLHDLSKSSTLQETFYREQKILNYAVGKLIEVPSNLLETYFVENKKMACSKVKISQVHNSVNIQKLTAVFCRHVYPRFYMQRKYTESRLAFMYYLKFGKINSYKKVIIDFFKLILLSSKLMNYIRDLKRVPKS